MGKRPTTNLSFNKKKTKQTKQNIQKSSRTLKNLENVLTCVTVPQNGVKNGKASGTNVQEGKGIGNRGRSGTSGRMDAPRRGGRGVGRGENGPNGKSVNNKCVHRRT